MGVARQGLELTADWSLESAASSIASFLFCRFLDEVQAHSDVNKMSVQNLATVFGPNILRPQIEDPVTIMEGKVEVAWQCPKLGDFGIRARPGDQ